MLASVKLLIVGCGSMGSAMIRGWANAGVGDKTYTVVCPKEDSIMPLRDICQINWFANPESIPPEYSPDIVVLAVKPQMMKEVLREYYSYALNGAIFITVAAGLKLDYYKPFLGSTTKIIRIMPNLPVAYNKGMTFGYAANTIEALDLNLCNSLLITLGKMIWLEDEEFFDAASAVSGCGPAYLYLLTHALTQAGIKAGLDPNRSEILARQSLIGAATLLDHSPENAEILKKKVASPGGMTQAALNILENPNDGLEILMTKAIEAAVKRSKELANA